MSRKKRGMPVKGYFIPIFMAGWMILISISSLAWYGPIGEDIWTDRIPIQITNNGAVKTNAQVVLQFKDMFGDNFNYNQINFNSIRLTDSGDNLVSFDYADVSVPTFVQDIVKNKDSFKGNDMVKFQVGISQAETKTYYMYYSTEENIQRFNEIDLSQSIVTDTELSIVIDPNLDYVKRIANNDKFLVYSLPVTKSVNSTYMPKKNEIISGIELFKAQGEYSSYSVSVFALQEISGLQLSISELSGTGNSIPSSNIKVNMIGTYGISTDALVPLSQISMPKSSSKRYWLVFHIPDNQEPGNYTGTITISSSQASIQIPVKLNVLNFKLIEPDKAFLIWYRINYISPGGMSSYDALLNNFKEIRTYGINSLFSYEGTSYPVIKGLGSFVSWSSSPNNTVTVNWANAELYFQAAHIAGIDKRIFYWAVPRDAAKQGKVFLQGVISEFEKKSKELRQKFSSQFPVFGYMSYDEARAPGDEASALWIKEAEPNAVVETDITSLKYCGIEPKAFDDKSCCSRNGWKCNWFLSNEHDHFDAIMLHQNYAKKALYDIFKETTPYHGFFIAGTSPPESMRYNTGFLHYKLNLTIFHVNTFYGGWAEAVEPDSSNNDLFVSTQRWENLREGLNDQKYWNTFDIAVENALKSGNDSKSALAQSLKTQAETMLDAVGSGYEYDKYLLGGDEQYIYSWDAFLEYGFGNAEGAHYYYDSVRNFMAQGIEQLEANSVCGDNIQNSFENCYNCPQDVQCVGTCTPQGICCQDTDNDGFLPLNCGGPDCDDSNPVINPNAQDICGNGILENCLSDAPCSLCQQNVTISQRCQCGSQTVTSGYCCNGQPQTGFCTNSVVIIPLCTQNTSITQPCQCGNQNISSGYCCNNVSSQSPCQQTECNDGNTQSCGVSIGECKSGTKTCTQGKWGSCIGSVEPVPEVCDSKDNTCDGSIDEGCNCTYNETKQCGYSDVGACGLGYQTCTNNEWGQCTNAVMPVEEICNGIDDNCDSSIDEALGDCGNVTIQQGCVPKWVCSAWSECNENKKRTRECTDTNNCSTTASRPPINSICTTKSSSSIVKTKNIPKTSNGNASSAITKIKKIILTTPKNETTEPVKAKNEKGSLLSSILFYIILLGLVLGAVFLFYYNRKGIPILKIPLFSIGKQEVKKTSQQEEQYMVIDELEKQIRTMKAQGMSEQKIRHILESKEWDKEVIEKAMR